ncbi:MAG TPA: Na+/H+ antiporter [Marmoricola sp.]|nr:Na+/H+ antiporter [Marmoricola sp.]
MTPVLLVLVLVAGVVVCTPLADTIGVPQPVLLTVLGLGLGALPWSPELTALDPHLVLPLVLPPLLFAATQRTTAHEFREHAGAVVLLAVGLTVATVAVAAVVAHAVGLPWPAAWVVGAVVSPPDPVAATAVARRLRLPHRLVTVLEGEGMFNDATALVAYKVAVAAVVTGSLSPGDTVVALVLAVAVGLAVGLVLGWATRVALAALHEGYAETTVTVLAPFAAYLAAERLGGSGVLAVLALGLYLRTYGHRATTSQGWLLGRSVWSFVDFLVTSLVFALLGYELIQVIGRPGDVASFAGPAAAVVGAVVLFRAVWVYPSAWLARLRARRRDAPLPIGWRESTVVAWAGMRGVVTVATALALPRLVDDGSPFPRRDAIVFIALACVLVTLVVQGLSLAPLVRALHVGGEQRDRGELLRLRRQAAGAALQVIRESEDGEFVAEVREAALQQWEGYIAAQTALAHARAVELEEGDAAEQLGELLARATTAERDVVLRARRRGEVSASTADEALRDIETRALRDFG